MPLPGHESGNQKNVVNINVNLSHPVQEVNINSTGTPLQPQFSPAPFPPVGSEPDQLPLDTDSYQPQNQTGFQQWKQLEQNRFTPPLAPVQPVYPYQNAPYYPQHPFQMTIPSIWRRGEQLVVHKSAILPDTCVKCNEYIANGGYSTQKYRWHNPLVYIALISPLIYAILALCLSQRGSVSVPLCDQHYQAKKKTGNHLLAAGLISIPVIFLSFATEFVGFGFFIFFCAMIGLVIGYEYFYKPLQLSKVENDYLHLKGACNEYLSQFQQM